MKALREHIIHDETNASVDLSLNDATVHRQLAITREEYHSKRSILEKLTDKGTHLGKSYFKSGKVETKLENRFEASFFTEDQAVLKVSLTRYGDSKFYFGTMGSPIKILTGQNLVEMKEHHKVSALAARLKCSLFEARSIYGFVLMRNLCKDVLGCSFFTPSEIRDIKRREISVLSVGYATYIDFGPKRNEYFHLLANLATARVEMDGDSFGLDSFLRMQAKNWRVAQGRDGWQGRNTGVVFQKKIDNAVACKQMMYLKDAEIEAKAETSGRRNRMEMAHLSAEDRSDLENRLVRVDNTFYKGYLKMWLTTLTGEKPLPGNVTIRDVAILFSDPATIRRMTQVMSCELGIRTLLMAPTMQRINALALRDDSPLSSVEKELLQLWLQVRTKVVTNEDGTGRGLSWERVVKAKNNHRYRAIQLKLINEQYIDITLPPAFYKFLQRARSNMFLSVGDSEALADDQNLYKGVGSLAHEAPEIRSKIFGEVQRSIRDLRKSLSDFIGVPLTKKQALKAIEYDK